MEIFCGRLAKISERGIFHGIDTNTDKNGIENKEVFMLINNRVGVANPLLSRESEDTYPSEGKGCPGSAESVAVSACADCLSVRQKSVLPFGIPKKKAWVRPTPHDIRNLRFDSRESPQYRYRFLSR